MIALLAEPGSLVEGASILLSEAEAHHLLVRRAEDGEEVVLLDGQGSSAEGVLADARHAARVEVTGVRQAARPAPALLAVAAGDRDRFAWLVEKAAELGVSDIVPLETERTAGVASRLRGNQLDRLRRLARETLKQCRSAWAPRVHDPVPLEAFVGRAPAGLRWLADREGAAPPPALAADAVSVVIGPEGGLTGEETAVLHSAGFMPVSFGPHILRFETAAIAAACIIGSARLRSAHA